MRTQVSEVRIIELPKILDHRGNLSFFEGGVHLPFSIRRTYWIYDVPGGQQRGGHAFLNESEFIVALSGSFNVTVTDGEESRVFHLNRSHYGLYIPKMIWRQMDDFSTNSLAMIASDSIYDPGQYLRDFESYKLQNA